MDLDAESLNVVGTVRTTGEVGQVKLDLVPALIETHGHRADERLDTRCRLVIGGTEASAHVLVIQHLHLEGEVLLQVLDDHNEERKLELEKLKKIEKRVSTEPPEKWLHPEQLRIIKESFDAIDEDQGRLHQLNLCIYKLYMYYH